MSDYETNERTDLYGLDGSQSERAEEVLFSPLTGEVRPYCVRI